MSLTLLLLLGVLPVSAQVDEEEEEDDSWGHLYFELGTWSAQPSGLGYEPATELDAANPFAREVIGLPHGTQTAGLYRMAIELNRNLGTVTLSYYGHKEDLTYQDLRPGSFVIGQTLTSPTFAGFGNDGLADGVRASAVTKLRDFRVDFSREAFANDRARGTWFVGWRRVLHDRNLEAEYFALAPLLPPVIPPLSNPRPDLDPLAERGFSTSSYNGRGPEAGMDFAFPLMDKGRLVIESGFAVAVLRGSVDASWGSTTAAYLLDDPISGTTILLGPPYDEFGQTVPNPDPMLPDIPLISGISQVQFTDGAQDNGRAAEGTVIDTYFGLRLRTWKALELFAGLRSTHYGNVGLEVRSNSTTGFSSESRSATYEGFYAGASWRF